MRKKYFKNMKTKKLQCSKCKTKDSKNNPIFQELDCNGYVVKNICMMCYAEELDENTDTNY
tara:strand:- start:5 stop:187 length:183 start_codon:yes stop_codon:yes gene_type:complete